MFYSRFAIDGIRKNKQLYIPYLLTCTMMVTIYYILRYLTDCEFLSMVHGGDSAKMILGLGMCVIFIFSIIFLIYTNSFLIRRRKKEFGLYNILGMNKKNIAIVLFWETVFNLVISLSLGLLMGIVFSKIFELSIVNILEANIEYSMRVDFQGILYTIEIFSTIQAIIYLKSIASISLSNPIEMVKAENVGEKKPKANWFLGLAGFILLGVGYMISISIKQPLSALLLFFVAVVLVIIGTYLVMISGSVLLCKILQKNKKYYYNPKHFVSLSQMSYRMKRNGAGLASICILMTMVLVMISSTSCLYFGQEDAIKKRYPRDYVAQFYYDIEEDVSTIEQIKNYINQTIKENNVQTSDVMDFYDVTLSGCRMSSDYVEIDSTKVNFDDLTVMENLLYVHFVTLDDYNTMNNAHVSLKEDEALGYSTNTDKLPETFTLGTKTYSIQENLKELTISGSAAVEAIPSVYLVVNELPVVTYEDGRDALQRTWNYGFNWNVEDEQAIVLDQTMYDYIQANITMGNRGFVSDTIVSGRRDFNSTFGMFLFIGCLLSFVFLMATVLIIYYKQICEGYEDESRFEIMQKVGMRKKDIRRSINSQMLTIFIFPIALAILHIGFAFPMIHKLLILFNVINFKLLVTTTMISVLICTLFYIIVYKITSNTYYKIVSH
ncbi:MAG: FtsX-like permease family protein [Bacillota bacterium]|nr:FtsX-like permease family protein [Bacillota bacterium]